jgi:hypothetical protein
VGKGSFNAVSLTVERAVEATLYLSQGAGRDHCDNATLGQVVQDGIGVVALVGEHGFWFALAEQRDGLSAIVGLSAGEHEAERQAQFVGEQVDLGRQTSSTPPQSGLRSPFFRAVAACWWARTTLESIMT